MSLKKFLLHVGKVLVLAPNVLRGYCIHCQGTITSERLGFNRSIKNVGPCMPLQIYINLK